MVKSNKKLHQLVLNIRNRKSVVKLNIKENTLIYQYLNINCSLYKI